MEHRRHSRVKRLDTADKLNGSKIYAIDLRLPGMLNAAIKQCPVFGGKLVSYDETKVARRPGVKRVVRVNDQAVAVVADTWWHAKTALDALPDRLGRWPRRGAIERDHRRAPEGRSYRGECPCVARRGRRAQGDRGRGEKGRGRLQHAFPRARDAWSR